ncbi:PorT family protein [Tenacibaculum sp. S7007]|uniref:PorT family protein n=2 Tax=Tenacibaculum pelagium TaxID=2759527 RepID=A0A839ASE7_9FLAO|nr:PorT family protein [Tenacibaculum pelagium]
MKYFITFFMLFSMLNIQAQKDSLQVGDKYWEDQLYINVTYNVLNNQPSIINRSGFSYGFSGGYIKDIPLKKNGKIAVGLGLGYSFDSFNHNLKVVEGTLNSFESGSDIASNKIKLNNLEMPIQFRWRSSTVNTYSFWRFYAGLKLSYNLSNTFSYTDNNTSVSINNITEYNKWQTGLIMSAGYGTFNFHVYYGLSPLFKNASINGNPIDTKILRFGLSFYLL